LLFLKKITDHLISSASPTQQHIKHSQQLSPTPLQSISHNLSNDSAIKVTPSPAYSPAYSPVS